MKMSEPSEVEDKSEFLTPENDTTIVFSATKWAFYLLGSSPMTQTEANVPSFSVGFPKIYLKTLRINN